MSWILFWAGRGSCEQWSEHCKQCLAISENRKKCIWSWSDFEMFGRNIWWCGRVPCFTFLEKKSDICRGDKTGTYVKGQICYYFLFFSLGKPFFYFLEVVGYVQCPKIDYSIWKVNPLNRTTSDYILDCF